MTNQNDYTEETTSLETVASATLAELKDLEALVITGDFEFDQTVILPYIRYRIKRLSQEVIQ